MFYPGHFSNTEIKRAKYIITGPQYSGKKSLMRILQENKLIAPIEQPPLVDSDDDYDDNDYRNPSFSRGYSTTFEIQTKKIRKNLMH